MSLQEGRNMNFMNSPSVYTLIKRIKCCLGWVRLFAASEVVLYENVCLHLGMASVTHYMPTIATKCKLHLSSVQSLSVLISR